MRRITIIVALAVAGGMWAARNHKSKGPESDGHTSSARVGDAVAALRSTQPFGEGSDGEMPNGLVSIERVSIERVSNDIPSKHVLRSAVLKPLPSDPETPPNTTEETAASGNPAVVNDDYDFDLDLLELHLRDARARVLGMEAAGE